jgi:hypothetical protein
MQELEIKQLWKAYQERIEENLQINEQNTQDITKMKIQTLLSSMKPIKIFTLIVGFLWVFPLGFILSSLFIHAYDEANLFFLYSMSIQVVICAIAMAVYIYQLILISKVDFTLPVLEIQAHLAAIKKSTLWVTRILFLQLPVWTTFYLSENTLLNGGVYWLIIQVIVTGLFTFLAAWLFVNIKYENRRKKWFQWIFKGKEWTPLMKSMELLNQISEFRKPDEIEDNSII